MTTTTTMTTIHRPVPLTLACCLAWLMSLAPAPPAAQAAQAAQESAQIALQEARRTLGQVERHLEAIPEQRYHEIRVAALKADRDERAAKAALESARAELEHYEVRA